MNGRVTSMKVAVGSTKNQLTPDLGAFRAVAAHFYLIASLQQSLPELPIRGATPKLGETMLL
jgi:hypothetical protein